MKLDTLALVIVCLGAGIWATLFLVTSIAMWPLGILLLIPLAVVGYFAYRVISDRLGNKEDDYYEKNVDR